jgi:hypothetical protein
VEEAALGRLRLETRVARSNAEAAVDALAGEPAAVERRRLYGAVGASSNRLAHSAMVLEAMGVEHGGDQPSGELPLSEPAFDTYAANASRTLSLLARVMRGENVSPEEFPDLRQSYEQWSKAAGDRRPLVASELDRMTNSINTLTERVAILRRAGT